MKAIALTIICFTLTTGTPLNARLGYLDPIISQEHIQSTIGRYKHGFKLNHAVAHQVHSTDGTAKGFYSYVYDQGKVHHVKYIASHDGYKVKENSNLPTTPRYTAEVEAARKAHLDAYLEVYSRVIAQQRYVTNNFFKLASGDQYKHAASRFGGNRFNNMFNGQPLAATHLNNNTLFSSTQSPLPATTPRTINNFTSKNLENKVYVSPSLKLNYYKKNWPLPPIMYRDLEVQVDGQDSYDPKTVNSNLALMPHIVTPQNTQNLYNSKRQYLKENVTLTQLFSQASQTQTKQEKAVSRTLTSTEFIEIPEKTKHLNMDKIANTSLPKIYSNPFGLTQTSLPLKSYKSIETQLSSSIQPQGLEVAGPTHFNPVLTAHQENLLKYQESLKVDQTLINNNIKKNTIVSLKITPRNNLGPTTKVVVTKSRKDVRSDIVAESVKKAFNAIKERYNLM